MDIFAFRVSSSKSQPYKVRLGHADEIPIGRYGGLSRENCPHVFLQFSTPLFGKNEKSESFRIAIEPEAFTDLAHEMMKLHPQQAIKAFGKAMQNFKIQVPDRK